MNNIATVAAALIASALWSAPTANADWQYDGLYFWVAGSAAGVMSAHNHITGNGGDPSRPTGTITNADADGCTIYTFESDPSLTQVDVGAETASGFMSGRVTSGGGPNCQSTTRVSFDISKNKVNGEGDLTIFDLDNNHYWQLKRPAGV
jgi:hypothetical protein